MIIFVQIDYRIEFVSSNQSMLVKCEIREQSLLPVIILIVQQKRPVRVVKIWKYQISPIFILKRYAHTLILPA